MTSPEDRRLRIVVAQHRAFDLPRVDPLLRSGAWCQTGTQIRSPRRVHSSALTFFTPTEEPVRAGFDEQREARVLSYRPKDAVAIAVPVFPDHRHPGHHRDAAVPQKALGHVLVHADRRIRPNPPPHTGPWPARAVPGGCRPRSRCRAPRETRHQRRPSYQSVDIV